MRGMRAVAAGVVLACAPGAADAPVEEVGQRTPKVLVIGIDGVRPDVLAEVATPNLDRLAAEGTFSDAAQTGRPTVSGPGWSSLLIGVWPAKHGVTNNEFTGKRYDRYPDFLTRIEQVRPELRTFAVVDWPPLGMDTMGGPVLSAAIDDRTTWNGYALGWDVADSLSVLEAVHQLTVEDPDAGFVYLGNPDEVSHAVRSIGEEYRAAIALADRHVGMLVDAVRGRPTYADEDWLILVSTDHGRRADGGHGGDSAEESTIFYIASGPSAAVGRPATPPNVVDVAVTALVHLGIALDPAWELDGRPAGLRGGGN